MNNINKNKVVKIIEGEQITFDSPMEYEYYEKVLKPRLESEEIKELKFHPSFVLIPAFKHKITGEENKEVIYTADYSYIDCKSNLYTVVEYKGYYGMSDFMLRKKMFLYFYPDYDYKMVQYANKDLGFIEVVKGHSIKLLKKRNRKNKEHLVLMDDRKYQRLRLKNSPNHRFTTKEQEFIKYYNERYKNKLKKKDLIIL